MMRVTDQLAIRAQDLSWRFVRAPGPGGQNVNTVCPVCKGLSYSVRLTRRLLAVCHHLPELLACRATEVSLQIGLDRVELYWLKLHRWGDEAAAAPP